MREQAQVAVECIDIGANLTHASFRGDVARVIAAAQAVGVAHLIVTGTSLENSHAAQFLVAKYPGVLYSTVGVHPHDASHFSTASLEVMRRLAAGPGVVALGECGLDFNRDFSPRDLQRRCFEAQLQLASELRLPLFLHERDAHVEFLEILRPVRERLGPVVVHCFTGTAEQARAYLDLDLHLGVTGWLCDERRGLHLQEIVRWLPLERLMLETDSPYLAPRDLRPKVHRNEPQFLPHILRRVAACRGAALVPTAAAIADTTRAFFGLSRGTAIPAPAAEESPPARLRQGGDIR